MDKFKTFEEGQEKTPPVLVVEKHEAPEKKDGPQMAGKAPAAAHAPAVVMPVAAEQRREGDTEQARKMAAMQRQVGNARLSRLLAGQDGHAGEQAEKEKEHS
jgi:hypothetical protein